MTEYTRPVFPRRSFVAVHMSDAPTWTVQVISHRETRFGRVYKVRNITGRRPGKVEELDEQYLTNRVPDPRKVAAATNPPAHNSAEFHALTEEIAASALPIENLARWVMNGKTTSVAIVAGTAVAEPIWAGTISTYKPSAREYTDMMLVDAREAAANDHPEGVHYVRWCFAEALVMAGWTLAKLATKR